MKYINDVLNHKKLPFRDCFVHFVECFVHSLVDKKHFVTYWVHFVHKIPYIHKMEGNLNRQNDF